jgi:hypothetical protein
VAEAPIALATEAFPLVALRAEAELSGVDLVATVGAMHGPAVHGEPPAWVLEAVVAPGAADGGGKR